MLFRAAQRKHEPDKQIHTSQGAGAGIAGTLIECGVAMTSVTVGSGPGVRS